MPSPFPGMDPYLQSQPFWSPLHSGLITAIQGELKKRVPRNYSVWQATNFLRSVKRKVGRFLKIMEARSDRVITVIELLSPSNKTPGDDRDAYLSKRNEYLATGTNLVEIDLLRMGRRMPMGEPSPPSAHYYVMVSRAAEYPKTAIWHFGVREPLPEIAVPLKPEDGCVLLPLKPCLDWAYDIGPYDNEVDYAQPPRIPLSGEDEAWAKQILRG